MRSVRDEARRAGLLYLLIVATAWVGLIYVPSAVLVSGNAAETAERIRASESIIRAGIASELFHQIVQIYLVLSLYRLFRATDPSRARSLVVLGALVSVPIVFVNVLNEFAALRLAGNTPFLAALPRSEADALAYLFMSLHSQGVRVAAVFWGMWLLPFGSLAIRSGFIPKIFGYLLLVAGGSYLADEFAALIVPPAAGVVSSVAGLLELAELPIVLWLAIRGARGPGAEAAAAP